MRDLHERAGDRIGVRRRIWLRCSHATKPSVDVVPAPGARLAVQQIDVGKVVQSRRASRGCRARPGSAAAGSKGFAKTDRAAQRLVMIGSMGKAKAETPETKPVERTKQLDDVADHERQEDNGKLDSTIDKGA
jgi:hypothetical protein